MSINYLLSNLRASFLRSRINLLRNIFNSSFKSELNRSKTELNNTASGYFKPFRAKDLRMHQIIQPYAANKVIFNDCPLKNK